MDNALNYRETDNDQKCEGCHYGQFDSVCLLHNFKHDPGHTCDAFAAAAPVSLKSFQVVDLPRPHGYLVWHGKQQAIASPEPLPIGEVLITSEGEAYGLATLGQPAQMTVSEFQREEQAEKHCTRPEERKTWWPKVSSLYVYGIKEWNGFDKPQPIIDDHITLYEPTEEESTLIEKGKRLPKVITLHSEAVSLVDGGFTALDSVRGKELSAPLQAAFGRLRFLEESGEKVLPLYDLALVRRPALRYVKKKGVNNDGRQ